MKKLETNFNYFDEALEKGIRYGQWYTLLALKGNPDKFGRDSFYGRGGMIHFKSNSDRTKESHKVSDARVLIYDKGVQSLDWLGTYISNKGTYFKKKGRKYYL